jgi:hypothetical protein
METIEELAKVEYQETEAPRDERLLEAEKIWEAGMSFLQAIHEEIAGRVNKHKQFMEMIES